MASRFSSTTTRIPSLSDSSLTPEIPSIFFSDASSAMALTRFSLLTWYGISVTTICDLPDDSFSSIWARARMTTRPRPVS